MTKSLEKIKKHMTKKKAKSSSSSKPLLAEPVKSTQTAPTPSTKDRVYEGTFKIDHLTFEEQAAIIMNPLQGFVKDKAIKSTIVGKQEETPPPTFQLGRETKRLKDK